MSQVIHNAEVDRVDEVDTMDTVDKGDNVGRVIYKPVAVSPIAVVLFTG